MSSKAERERRHHATVDTINRVQRLAGSGDTMRVDHEATLLDRARMLMDEISAHETTERGLAAFDRLLRHAETRDAPHRRDIVAFITAVWSHQPLPLRTLRGLDPVTGDDMIAVLDAFRHGRGELAVQVEGGPQRVARVVRAGAS